MIVLMDLWRHGEPGQHYWVGKLGRMTVLVFQTGKHDQGGPDLSVFLTEEPVDLVAAKEREAYRARMEKAAAAAEAMVLGTSPKPTR